jgi:hypothetical protein
LRGKTSNPVITTSRRARIVNFMPFAEPLLSRWSSKYSIISGDDGAGLQVEGSYKINDETNNYQKRKGGIITELTCGLDESLEKKRVTVWLEHY